MKNYNATLFFKTKSTLSEGPLWVPSDRRLFWVDIEQMKIHSSNLVGEHQVWSTKRKVSFIVPTQWPNVFIIGLQGELAKFNAQTGDIETLIKIESDKPNNRCNDAKADHLKRLWFGTMHIDCIPKQGALYCLNHNLILTKEIKDLTIANGMGWSKNNQWMYFIDSEDRNVKAFSLDDQGNLNDSRIIISAPKNELPDGMCVDSKGNLWVAFWGGARVGCYDSSTGQQLVEVKVPAPNVTSCTFGGDDLKTLFITTARQGLTEAQLNEFPLSGSIFECRPGIDGSLPFAFHLKNE